jgi:hypothetical protein
VAPFCKQPPSTRLNKFGIFGLRIGYGTCTYCVMMIFNFVKHFLGIWSLKLTPRKAICTAIAQFFLETSCFSQKLIRFFFLKRSVIEGVRLNPTGYKLGLEILVKGRYRRLREIPYTFKQRRNGSSKLNKSEIFSYLRLLTGLHLFTELQDCDVMNNFASSWAINNFNFMLKS